MDDKKIVENFQKTNKFMIELNHENSEKIKQIYIMPILNMDIINQEKYDMANECLYNILLDVQNIFSEDEYEIALNMLVPGLADYSYRHNPHDCTKMMMDYELMIKNEEPVIYEVYNKMLDETSKLSFILMNNIHSMKDDINALGLARATEENKIFIKQLHFGLINIPSTFLDAALSYKISITIMK